jgi:hypothetical protein
LSCVGPFQEKATRLPSGERLGACSVPGYAVSGRAGAGEVVTAPVRGSRSTMRNVATTSKATVAIPIASHSFLVLRSSVTEEGAFSALLSVSVGDLPDGSVLRTSALNR